MRRKSLGWQWRATLADPAGATANTRTVCACHPRHTTHKLLVKVRAHSVHHSDTQALRCRLVLVSDSCAPRNLPKIYVKWMTHHPSSDDFLTMSIRREPSALRGSQHVVEDSVEPPERVIPKAKPRFPRPDTVATPNCHRMNVMIKQGCGIRRPPRFGASLCVGETRRTRVARARFGAFCYSGSRMRPRLTPRRCTLP